MFIENVLNEVSNGNKVALVLVTQSSGSTPADVGKEMIVYEDGSSKGTVGGGNLEYRSIEKALECLRNEKDQHVTFNLTNDLNMNCGGEVSIFIKIYKPKDELIIIGGGHVGCELNKFAKLLNFHTTIVDNRELINEGGRLDSADDIKIGEYIDILDKIKMNSLSTYVVIATHGHLNDEEALYYCINKNTRYIGVIGSKLKVKTMMESLKSKGIDDNKLSKIYSPIGLSLGGNSPAEVALSIISEIMLIKNKGKLEHMKKHYEDLVCKEKI